MDKRTLAIVVTVVAVLFCACPGLIGLLMGGMFAVVSAVPGADIDVFGSSDPVAARNFGVGSICISLVFLLIAAGAIFWAWRRNRAQV